MVGWLIRNIGQNRGNASCISKCRNKKLAAIQQPFLLVNPGGGIMSSFVTGHK